MESKKLHREISKAPQCPKMDPELISVLTDLCFQKESITRTDLLFVFGSNVQHKEMAEIILDLLDRDLTDQVLITGGVPNYEGSFYRRKPESESIITYIPEEKRNGKKIILENLSKNTLENVIEAAKIFSFDQIKSITFLCHSYASTRSALSLRKFFPDINLHCIPFSLPSDNPDYPVNSQHWHKTRYGQSLILGEYMRLITYGTRGDFHISEIGKQLDKVQVLLGIKQ